MSESLIERNLSLDDEVDRNYLISRLHTRHNLPLDIGQIKQGVAFLCEKMDLDWLTLYPFYSSAHVPVRVGPKLTHALDFFYVVRFGLALRALSELLGFERFVKKIAHPSYERLSTILEALTAARYKIAGYEVELEPRTQKGFADFKVRFQNEWIYFECKRENLRGSKYYVKAQQYVDETVEKVLSTVESKLPLTHRIDIVIENRLDLRLLTKLGEEISNDIDRKTFDEWRRLNGIRFAVNQRKTKLELKGMHLLQIKAVRTPTQVSETNAHIQVVYDPFGSQERRKFRRLIGEARDQLPTDARSIIVLETERTEKMVRIAEQKLKQAEYGQVIVILVIGDVAWTVPNPSQSLLPLEFVRTAILPNPI